MTSAKKKKLYGVILGSCGLAFLVDTFLLDGSPDSATASMVTSGATIGMPVSFDGKTNAKSIAIPQIHFPSNLSSFTFSSELPDLFEPPDKQKNLQDKTENDDLGLKRAGAIADPSLVDTQKFEEKKQLDAIYTGDSLKIAIVNGQWVHLGQTIDGCKLKEIRTNEAVFECYDGDIVMRIKGKTNWSGS